MRKRLIDFSCNLTDWEEFLLTVWRERAEKLVGGRRWEDWEVIAASERYWEKKRDADINSICRQTPKTRSGDISTWIYRGVLPTHATQETWRSQSLSFFSFFISIVYQNVIFIHLHHWWSHSTLHQWKSHRLLSRSPVSIMLVSRKEILTILESDDLQTRNVSTRMKPSPLTSKSLCDNFILKYAQYFLNNQQRKFCMGS